MYYAVTEPGYRTVKAQQATLLQNQVFTVTTNNNRNTKYKRLVSIQHPENLFSECREIRTLLGKASLRRVLCILPIDCCVS
jgi:hypothetical protein